MGIMEAIIVVIAQGSRDEMFRRFIAWTRAHVHGAHAQVHGPRPIYIGLGPGPIVKNIVGGMKG